jgi:glycosyltransferase involved in cell wall biosynthesis
MANPILRHRQPPKDASGASAAFLTLPGLDRLGGIDKFTQRQLSIGGRAIQKIDNFYCLAPEYCVTVADNLILLPFFERVDDGDVLLFDINPAYSEDLAEPVTATVNVPRTILLITKVANLPERLENFGSTSASFVMSCFNKVHYLAAAWYSVVMQTYQNIELTFLDDGSSDTSVALIKELSSWTVEPFRLHINCFQHHGTYWLRNFLINKKINESVIYLVQDADDYSTAQRALLQVNLIQDQQAPVLLLLADIVRTDSQYRLLELDGELERYGSATLAADVQLHRNYGYFEHLRKNADTEFINRIKRFGGEAGLRWFRYPVLFQPYDGNNLTADIYTFNDQGTRLAQNIEARTLHKELFSKRQRGLKLHQLTDEYGFPAQVFPGFYYEKLADFLLDKFLGFSLVTAIDLQAMLPGLIDDNAGKQLDDGSFKFTLHKKNQEHSYFYSTTLLPSSLFYQQQLPDSQRVALSFEADVVGQANLVLVYLDTEKNKLSHQFFYFNQVAVVQLPPNASWVRLGVKLTGEASMTLNRIEIGWMVTSG